MDNRISWDQYFMKIAFTVAERATCFSEPKGALIVQEKAIISTGYNGAPVGIHNCKYEKGFCERREKGFQSGEGLHICKATHAEANAIVRAAYHGQSTKNAFMYCTHKPCFDCCKLIINAGIIKVFYSIDYPSALSENMFAEANVELTKIYF